MLEAAEKLAHACEDSWREGYEAAEAAAAEELQLQLQQQQQQHLMLQQEMSSAAATREETFAEHRAKVGVRMPADSLHFEAISLICC